MNLHQSIVSSLKTFIRKKSIKKKIVNCTELKIVIIQVNMAEPQAPNEQIQAVISKSTEKLYNPKLRTSVSREIWDKAPGFFEQNKESLKFYMGSDNVEAHIHGSALLGVSTEGVNHPDPEKNIWLTPPSDADVIIFVGKKDHCDKQYQAKFGEEDEHWYKDRDDLKNNERGHRFAKESHANEVFARRFDYIIVRIPELISQLQIACQKAVKGEKFNDTDLYAAYNSMVLLTTEPIYRTNQNETMDFKRDTLNMILSAPGGEIIWDNLIRPYFHYLMVQYEHNRLGAPNDQVHKQRVALAATEILKSRGVSSEHANRVLNFLRKRRTKIQLPAFKELAQ